jgi:hypothetical protein
MAALLLQTDTTSWRINPAVLADADPVKVAERALELASNSPTEIQVAFGVSIVPVSATSPPVEIGFAIKGALEQLRPHFQQHKCC